MINQEYRKNSFTITTDKSKLNLSIIHNFLKKSYWAENIQLSIVERSIKNSLCFGVFEGENQIGFARVITDYSTFAYLADVFILENYRGKGLSKWLMECILSHPELQGFRRWLLATKDAHGLYSKYGFKSLKTPERWMEIHNPDVYKEKLDG
jgi:GNAT superfamily N-acetyltransferase